MFKSTLTSKGQITVPVAWRRQFDLQPGDELLFHVGPDGEVRVHTRKRQRLTDLFGSLPATRPYPGTDEVRREVAGKMTRPVLKKGRKTHKFPLGRRQCDPTVHYRRSAGNGCTGSGTYRPGGEEGYNHPLINSGSG
ncbi:MAG TPA: AbrB/MazE/SpoVT family DNA-binding domain-containing protein [Spirochaetia bacterium]|nr:AbrB/MazE/SpoVT family DNA-binding domain-containing protein [Spirochaetia bacterium]